MLRKSVFILIIIFFTPKTLLAEGYKLQDVKNPKAYCSQCHVSDMAGVLSANTINSINNTLAALEQETSSEIAIVILPSIGGKDVYSFAYELATLWGVGKAGVNNGVLWLYVVNRRAMHIVSGEGIEGVLPDGFLSNVLQERVFPFMRNGEVDKAFISGVSSLNNRMLDEGVREEQLLKTGGLRVTAINYVVYYFVASLIIFIALLWLSFYRIKGLRGDNNIKYAAINADLAIIKIIGMVFFFPNYLLYLYLKRFRRLLREKPIDCHKCGNKMRLLSEDEEDAFLDKTKQNEEKFSSVDYDVWFCNNCESTRIIPYINVNTQYSKCPVCSARTYSLVSKRVLIEASTYSNGSGREEYHCKNCNYVKHIPFTIPQIVVPPVIMTGRGGGCGSSGGFGSNFGGGFGGGSFGGGGAGGQF